jgi:hypothetical protein
MPESEELTSFQCLDKRLGEIKYIHYRMEFRHVFVKSPYRDHRSFH